VQFAMRASFSRIFCCVQDLHELFSCDGFVLVQIGRQLIQLTAIVFQNVQRFFMFPSSCFFYSVYTGFDSALYFFF
jgi:hypothetical protein